MEIETIDRQVDVIVVGAGPVGCATALKLHQRGYQTLVVERTGWDNLHGPLLNGISERNLPLLHSLGIYSELEQCVVNQGMNLSVRVSPFNALHAEWSKGLRRLFFYRKQFDHLLREKVVQAGIEVMDQAKGLSLIKEDNRVKGVRIIKNQSIHRLGASMVFGCDGRQSSLASELKLPHTSNKHRRIYQGAVFDNTSFGSHAVHIFPGAVRGQLFLVFTLDGQPGNQAYVELETDMGLTGWSSLPHGMSHTQYFTEAWHQQPELSRLLVQAKLLESHHAVSLRQIQHKRLCAPGCVLLGDAAVTMDPIGSSGLILGLMSLLDFLALAPKKLEEMNLLPWERQVLARYATYSRFSGLLRWWFRHPLLLKLGTRWLGHNQSKVDLLMETFNGQITPGEFMQWRNQARFWLTQ